MPQRVNSSRAAVLAALVLGLFWCIEGIDVNAPQVDRVVLLLTGLALGWAALRGMRLAAAGAAGYAVLVAASERMHRELLEGGSDVMRATAESLDVVFAGGNPYTHTLQSTSPVGSPFVYPPGELAWYAVPYALFGDITRVDTWAGIAVVAAIAAAGVRVGMANVALPAMLYASWGAAGFRAIDGQNDVSGSLLVVLSLVALAFAEREGRWARGALIVSAVFFGWAIAFKQFAVLVLPPVLRYIAVRGADWRRYGLIVAGVVAAFVLPFFVRDPGAFIEKQIAALTFHDEIWGANILNTFAQHGDPAPLVPLFAAIAVVGTLALVALVARWRIPTLGAAALAGAGMVMLPLLLARWTTQPYYVYVGAIAACGVALLATRIDLRMIDAAAKADAMMLMERGWHDIDSRFAGLSDQDLEREVFTGEGSGWRLRDLMPHFAFWWRLAARGARRAAETGAAPDKNTTLRAFVGVDSHWDALNAETFARWRERSAAEQLAELRAARDELRSALAELPPPLLLADTPETDGIRSYVWQPAVNHLRQHAEHIDAALEKKGAST